MYRSAAALNKVGNTFLIAGGLLAAGIGYGIAKAAEFEKELSYFAAVSQSTQKELEGIRQKALQLGRDSAFGAGQVAKAFAELGKAGVPARDIINGVGDAIVSLAAAADIDLAQAATVVVNTLNTFQLGAKDAVHVVDLLAGGANASTVDIDDLATSLKYAGSVANALGIPVGDVIAALSELGNAGIRGSTGGTALRRILLNLNPVSDKATTAMKELGIITKEGANQFFTAEGKAKSLVDIIGILQNATSGLTAKEKIRQLNLIFGNRAVASAIILADHGTAAFEAMKVEMGKVTAEEVMKTRLDNLSGSLKILKSSIETAFIQNGAPLQKILQGWVQSLTKIVNAFASLNPHTQELILKVVLFTAAALLATGATFKLASMFLKMFLLIGQAIRGIQLLVGVVSSIASAFGEFFLVLLTNPIFLIVAAIVALGIALFVLYKKSETFRKIIDSIWQGLQVAWDAVLNFTKAIPGFFVRMWNDIYAGFSAAISWLTANWDIILAIFTGPIGLIVLLFRRFGDEILGAVTGAFGAVINFFQSLPGTLGNWASTALEAIMSFFQQLPYRLGFVIGFVIGAFIKFHIDMAKEAWQLAQDVFHAIVDFFELMPGRVIGALNAMWDAFYAWSTKTIESAVNTGVSVFHAIVDWFEQLPGNVIAIFNSVWDAVYAWGVRTLNTAAQSAQDIFNAVMKWFRDLPGNISAVLVSAWDAFYKFGVDSYNSVSDFMGRIYNSIRSNVQALPGIVSDALGNVIQAFKDLISKAYNIAKDFASGLWNGFKKGLGINSPSYIEKAMWQMNSNVHDSLGTLKKQVLGVQRVYNSMNGLGAVSLGGYSGTTQTGPADTSSGTAYSGDHFEFHEVKADPQEISQEILWQKRLRSR